MAESSSDDELPGPEAALANLIEGLGAAEAGEALLGAVDGVDGEGFPLALGQGLGAAHAAALLEAALVRFTRGAAALETALLENGAASGRLELEAEDPLTVVEGALADATETLYLVLSAMQLWVHCGATLRAVTDRLGVHAFLDRAVSCFDLRIGDVPALARDGEDQQDPESLADAAASALSWIVLDGSAETRSILIERGLVRSLVASMAEHASGAGGERPIWRMRQGSVPLATVRLGRASSDASIGHAVNLLCCFAYDTKCHDALREQVGGTSAFDQLVTVAVEGRKARQPAPAAIGAALLGGARALPASVLQMVVEACQAAVAQKAYQGILYSWQPLSGLCELSVSAENAEALLEAGVLSAVTAALQTESWMGCAIAPEELRLAAAKRRLALAAAACASRVNAQSPLAAVSWDLLPEIVLQLPLVSGEFDRAQCYICLALLRLAGTEEGVASLALDEECKAQLRIVELRGNPVASAHARDARALAERHTARKRSKCRAREAERGSVKT